jgi:hypothetical protein
LITLLLLANGCSNRSNVKYATPAQPTAESEAKLGCIIWNEANLITTFGGTEELKARYPSLSNFAAAARLDIALLDLSFAAQRYFNSEFFAGPRPNYDKVQAYCFGIEK